MEKNEVGQSGARILDRSGYKRVVQIENIRSIIENKNSIVDRSGSRIIEQSG